MLDDKSGRGRKKLFAEWNEQVVIGMANNNPKITTAAMKANLIAMKFMLKGLQLLELSLEVA